MAWSERQAALLQAMGLRVWGAATPQSEVVAGAQFADELPRLRPPQTAALPLERPVGSAVFVASTASPGAAHLPIASAQTAHEVQGQGEISQLGWSALRQAVSQCQACELHQTRKQTVFGAGHLQAHWMIIGEAPGAQEDAEGEPFVGAAGQLLDNMLRALALSRSAGGDAASSVYIANTLKCRPPSNRNPQPLEMQRCEPYLLRQIVLVQPKIILAMGRFAVQALLRSDEPMGRLRGRVHAFQGVPLVVTYHPAYLLRNLADKAKAWEDLCFAASLLGRSTGP